MGLIMKPKLRYLTAGAVVKQRKQKVQQYKGYISKDIRVRFESWSIVYKWNNSQCINMQIIEYQCIIYEIKIFEIVRSRVRDKAAIQFLKCYPKLYLRQLCAPKNRACVLGSILNTPLEDSVVGQVTSLRATPFKAFFNKTVSIERVSGSSKTLFIIFIMKHLAKCAKFPVYRKSAVLIFIIISKGFSAVYRKKTIRCATR